MFDLHVYNDYFKIKKTTDLKINQPFNNNNSNQKIISVIIPSQQHESRRCFLLNQ